MTNNPKQPDSPNADNTSEQDDNQSQPETVFKASDIKTSMLSMPDAGPMKIRETSGETSVLSLSWRVEFKIGEQKKELPLTRKVNIGRTAETDNNHGSEINFDLTPFGAYHFGVSRNHAIMTFGTDDEEQDDSTVNEGYLFLQDLGSTNGTRINGFQMTANQKYRLRNGDEIEFARLRATVHFKGPRTL